MTESKTEYRYFSSVKGHAVPRWGSEGFIGLKRTPNGWKWDERRVVRIPILEADRYHREYADAIKTGSLLERTEKDFDDYWRTVEESIKPSKPVQEDPVESPVETPVEEEKEPEKSPDPPEKKKPRDESKKRTRRKKTKKK